MSNEIIKIIDKLAEKFGIVIDWTNKNVVPELEKIVDRLIKYDIATNILWTVVLIVLTILLGFLLLKLWKRWKKEEYRNDWDTDEDLFMGLTVAVGNIFCIVLLITIICVPVNVNRIIQDVYIPEITVIDYIKDLI